jgi:hypothetical protein
MSSLSELRELFYDGIRKILKTNSVHIYNADMTRIDKLNEIDEIYTAISKEDNKCREFGILSLETVLPGVELLYDAEYLLRNANAEPNQMATDLFGHIMKNRLYGPVVLRQV